MLLLALMALLAVQDPAPPPDANVVAPLVIEGRKATEVPSNLEITEGLNDLVKKEPDRMVCFMMTSTRSRIPRPQCGSLRAWYRLEENRAHRPDGVREDRPPIELVDAIRAQYMRKATQIQAQKAAKAEAANR